MEINQIKRIGVIGAGTMGTGIAQIASQSGFDVIICDTFEGSLEKSKSILESNLSKAVELGKMEESSKNTIIERIHFTSHIEDVIAEVIIEAVVEILEVKRNLFVRLAEINSPETILASNTSSIPITQIGFGIPHPERIVGMHFFNPAHLMKLVEVISGAATSKEVESFTFELAKKLGKVPVLAKDSAGFIVNRVARQYYVESLKILEENITDLEEIDGLLESIGFKMGPFKLMDLIGVDTNFSVTSSMYEQFFQDPKFRPSRIQKQKVDAGHWGKKSGIGFYNYSK